MWNRIIGLIGPSGSGKSHEAARIMEASERAAVYQLVRDDTNFLGPATDIFDGDIKAFCRALGESEFRYIYKVAEGAKKIDGNKFVLPDFRWFIQCCFERRNMLMLIDEAHFLCNPRYIPAQFWESIVTGRHMYLDICYMTQRFTMVHHDITANTHEFRFWKVIEPADIAAIRDRCGEDIAAKVSALRGTVDNRQNGGSVVPGEMLVWSKNQGGYNLNDRSNASEGELHQVQPVRTVSTE